MSRIRSIHPGIWTDEAFASLSDSAFLFYIGLLNEADDQGIFEWKPVTLRMRLRPSKDGPIDPLLTELEAHQVIRQYTIDGRQLGAIRNFTRYQRPKFPKSVHTITEDIRKYVGSTPPITEIDGDEQPPFPRNGEKPSQREEGGGRREKKVNGAHAPPPLVFRGAKIHVSQADYDRLRSQSPGIPDLMAELRKADAYYVENPRADGKYFFALTRWLVKANNDALAASREAAKPKATMAI